MLKNTRDLTTMICWHTAIELIRKYHIEKIYIDGANPSFIRSLKIALDEDPDYERAIARYKSQGFRNWEDNAWMKSSAS